MRRMNERTIEWMNEWMKKAEMWRIGDEVAEKEENKNEKKL